MSTHYLRRIGRTRKRGGRKKRPQNAILKFLSNIMERLRGR